jgi:hypothetical protein
MIDPFLRDIVARRGIFDYLIVCDERNNTAERIDRNELWCDIYIKPTRAAEFIVLNLIATKTGASFTELLQQHTLKNNGGLDPPMALKHMLVLNGEMKTWKDILLD